MIPLQYPNAAEKHLRLTFLCPTPLWLVGEVVRVRVDNGSLWQGGPLSFVCQQDGLDGVEGSGEVKKKTRHDSHSAPGYHWLN